MNRIEEIKERLEVGKYTEDGYQGFYAREDIEYLLSRLEIVEKALADLENYKVLNEVDLDKIIAVAKFTTGTELMIHESNVRLIEHSNAAKKFAKEALKQIRE